MLFWLPGVAPPLFGVARPMTRTASSVGLLVAGVARISLRHFDFAAISIAENKNIVIVWVHVHFQADNGTQTIYRITNDL